jgi:uncharacterized spore protein YtfJ
MTKRKVEGSGKEAGIPSGDASLAYSMKAAEEMFATADVSRVYGKPVIHENTVIIPAAEVLWAGGFGSGGGFGEGPVQMDEELGWGGGMGSGGGGRSFARPVAVIIASATGVRVEPVIDPTKILLAAFTAGGFIAAMTLRMISPRKALRNLERE